MTFTFCSTGQGKWRDADQNGWRIILPEQTSGIAQGMY
jgi:hypothetical protein